MLKQLTLILILTLSGTASLSAQPEQITITTYYPSPYGSYNQLQTNSLGVGDNDGDDSLDSGDVPTTAGDVWIKGKVGIGTTNPGGELHIKSSGTSDVIIDSTNANQNIWFRNNGTDTFAIEVETDGDALFTTRNTTADMMWRTGAGIPVVMTLTDLGNVGIGTAGPGELLHVVGTNPALKLENGTTNAGFVTQVSDTLSLAINRSPATGAHDQTGKASANFDLVSGNLDSYITLGTSAANNTTPTERIRIDKNGNVGIGTAGPAAKLHIQSTANNATHLLVNNNNPSTNSTSVWFRDTDTAGPGHYVFRVTADYDADAGGPYELAIRENGRVGIGTLNPGAQLDVFGGQRDIMLGHSSTRQWRFKVEDNATLAIKDATGADYSVANFSGNWAGGNIYLNPRNRLIVTANGFGGAFCDGFSWNPASSREIKQDISKFKEDDYRRIISELKQINPVWFRYKGSADRRLRPGLIAEEMPEELATPDKKGLNTTAAIGFLMAAVKAQQKEIEELKTQLKSK